MAPQDGAAVLCAATRHGASCVLAGCTGIARAQAARACAYCHRFESAGIFEARLASRHAGRISHTADSES